jgi:hypothetical protein
MVFAVPPGFVAPPRARPREAGSSQLGWFTVANRLSLRRPKGLSVSSSRVIFAGSTGRGSHCLPIASPVLIQVLVPFTAFQSWSVLRRSGSVHSRA